MNKQQEIKKELEARNTVAISKMLFKDLKIKYVVAELMEK